MILILLAAFLVPTLAHAQELLLAQFTCPKRKK